MRGNVILQQVRQLLAVLLRSALLPRFIASVQRGQRPGLFRPCRNLLKCFRREIVAPDMAPLIFRATPVAALSNISDLLGGGLILGLGGFVITPAWKFEGKPHFLKELQFGCLQAPMIGAQLIIVFGLVLVWSPTRATLELRLALPRFFLRQHSGYFA